METWLNMWENPEKKSSEKRVSTRGHGGVFFARSPLFSFRRAFMCLRRVTQKAWPKLVSPFLFRWLPS